MANLFGRIVCLAHKLVKNMYLYERNKNLVHYVIICDTKEELLKLLNEVDLNTYKDDKETNC